MLRQNAEDQYQTKANWVAFVFMKPMTLLEATGEECDEVEDDDDFEDNDDEVGDERPHW